MKSKFLTVTRFLLDQEFQRVFCMKRETFNLLLFRLRKYLHRNERQESCSSSGVVPPAERLAIRTRMPAGGSYHDKMMCLGVSHSMTFSVFVDTPRAVYLEFKKLKYSLTANQNWKLWPKDYSPPEVIPILCTLVLELRTVLQLLLRNHQTYT